ncbi:MAG: aquaporin family protein [Candidatus Nanopelagicaceae bacterium]|nr:aquaporin family protein [Candidatus Nanopelagicaceae bacterium]
MKKEKLTAELVGTASLLIAVVGSSFMANRLTSDRAIALLINAAVTAAALAVLIKVFAPVSGAHLNPAVSLAAFITKRIDMRDLLGYATAQLVGAVLGVFLANAMFSNSIFNISEIERSGSGQIIGELIATIGLVLLAISADAKSAWKLIPLWIFGAYFFTVSTSFANPVVTVSRTFTDAPAGIAPTSVTTFVLCQFLAASLAAWIFVRKERA